MARSDNPQDPTTGLTRRATLKWISAVGSALAISTTLPACGTDAEPGIHAPWPEVTLDPVTAPGYGTDPELITPAPVPWPRLMSTAQLAATATLADIIVPAEDNVPAASAVGVVEFIDEWISAPYPTQQEHRGLLVAGLQWLDDEASRRFTSRFVELTQAQQIEIVDDLAAAVEPVPATLQLPRLFFSGFRTLVVGAFFTTPEGVADLGYQGNVAIAGDYPGPSAEAEAHLRVLLEQLGLDGNEVDATG